MKIIRLVKNGTARKRTASVTVAGLVVLLSLMPFGAANAAYKYSSWTAYGCKIGFKYGSGVMSSQTYWRRTGASIWSWDKDCVWASIEVKYTDGYGVYRSTNSQGLGAGVWSSRRGRSLQQIKICMRPKRHDSRICRYPIKFPI